MSVEKSTFLYLLRPTRPEMLSAGPTPEENRIIAAHFSHLECLVAADIVLLAGRTLTSDPSSFGIVILKAGSEEEARQVMLADPAIGQGVMRADLYPFRIALCANDICVDGDRGG